MVWRGSAEKSDAATASFNALSADQGTESDDRQRGAQKQIVNYAKTRGLWNTGAGYSKNLGGGMRRKSFCTRRRRNTLTSLGIKKLVPSVKSLAEE